MLLALGLGVLDEVIIGELLRIHEHGAGDLDFVVEGEPADKLRRGVVQARHLVRQFGTRLHLDIRGKLLENVVEQLDLFHRVAARSGDEEVRDALHNAEPLFRVAGGNGADQLIDQGAAGRKGGVFGGGLLGGLDCLFHGRTLADTGFSMGRNHTDEFAKNCSPRPRKMSKILNNDATG